MANTVVLKRSAVTGRNPTTGDLALGELALNTYDGNLFFKKDSGTASIVTVATLAGAQTLTNKTLTSPSLSSPTITGTLTAGGTTGTNGQLLASTGSGLQWVTRDVSTLDSLTDVTISSATAGQVLKFSGSAWINAASDAVIASAVFATNAQSDLGSVADAIVAAEEDLGSITDVASLIYDMGQLKLDGIVSLSNIDQSVKADYIGYSIIFGF
jgi:hypothetical protein